MEKIIDNRYFLESELPVKGASLFNIFKARDTIENKLVIVKILKDEFAGNEEIIKNFQTYYQNLRINVKDTTYLAKVTQLNGPQSKRVYLVREFHEGKTLQEFIELKSGLTSNDLFPILKQICQGLHSLHFNNLFCYKVTPDDILITSEGNVKILSYGSLYSVLGNLEIIEKLGLRENKFIAPEMISGNKKDDISSAADIYSIGKILEILPVHAKESTINKAIEKDPALRFPKVQDFLKAVEIDFTTPVSNNISEPTIQAPKEETKKEVVKSETTPPQPVKPELKEEEPKPDKITIKEWTKHFSVNPNTDFEFVPEISVNEPKLLKIKCVRKPQDAKFNSVTGKINWRPVNKDAGLHTIEIEIIYNKEKADIKFQIEVTKPEVIKEPSIDIKPNLPKKIKQGDSIKCIVKCNDPEFFGLSLTKLPGFIKFEFDKPEESGSLELKPEENDTGEHEIIFTVFSKKGDGKESKDFVFKVKIEEKPKIEKPKEEQKSEPSKSSVVSHLKSWLPTVLILGLVVIISFSIIYFRPTEYVPSPLSASPEIIQSEKASFESWLKQNIKEKIQDAQISGALGVEGANRILREVIQEGREKINYTILENEIDLSVPRVRQIINELK